MNNIVCFNTGAIVSPLYYNEITYCWEQMVQPARTEDTYEPQQVLKYENIVHYSTEGENVSNLQLVAKMTVGSNITYFLFKKAGDIVVYGNQDRAVMRRTKDTYVKQVTRAKEKSMVTEICMIASIKNKQQHKVLNSFSLPPFP